MGRNQRCAQTFLTVCDGIVVFAAMAAWQACDREVTKGAGNYAVQLVATSTGNNIAVPSRYRKTWLSYLNPEVPL